MCRVVTTPLTPNPVPNVIKSQLVWEDLDSWITPNEKFSHLADRCEQTGWIESDVFISDFESPRIGDEILLAECCVDLLRGYPELSHLAARDLNIDSFINCSPIGNL